MHHRQQQKYGKIRCAAFFLKNQAEGLKIKKSETA